MRSAIRHQSVGDEDVYDPYPRHGHRTPQQIAEDAGGAFEITVTRRMKLSDMNVARNEKPVTRPDAKDARDEAVTGSRGPASR